MLKTLIEATVISLDFNWNIQNLLCSNGVLPGNASISANLLSIFQVRKVVVNRITIGPMPFPPPQSPPCSLYTLLLFSFDHLRAWNSLPLPRPHPRPSALSWDTPYAGIVDTYIGLISSPTSRGASTSSNFSWLPPGSPLVRINIAFGVPSLSPVSAVKRALFALENTLSVFLPKRSSSGIPPIFCLMATGS